MKTLNITKERFEKSRYFQKKYGKLEFVSESGDVYKTESGDVIKFAAEKNDKVLGGKGKKPLVKKPISKKPIKDVDDDDMDDTDTVEEPRTKVKRITNFNSLKKYIETNAYNRDVGAAVDGDGRLGSVADEGNIIEWLNEIFKGTNVKVIKPPARYWYDIELKIAEGKSYYTNIKTTAGGADNISSKEGVLYYLSGGKTSDFKTFMKTRGKFQLNEGDETADYFLLVMFKNSKKMLFTSLGRLGSLTPNFYNQPFQIPWNRTENQDGRAGGRSPLEQKQYVASIWYKSISQGLEKLDYLRNTFKNIAGEFV